MDINLAKKARLKGFPGMTRLYGRRHTILTNYSELETIFRERMQLHIEIVLLEDDNKIKFYCGAIKDTSNLKVIHTVDNVDYEQVRLQLMNVILDKLPNKKGIKM